jgi:hypothetical protein
MELTYSLIIGVVIASITGVVIYQVVKRYAERVKNPISNIRSTYDDKAKMGYIYLNGRDPEKTSGVRTEEIAPGVYADYEISTGDLLGIEVFDTRRKR